MYSLKHVGDDGSETIVEAVSISYDPKGSELIGHGSPGPDEGARKGGVVRFNTGLVYVMNETGKTVGIYNLRK